VTLAEKLAAWVAGLRFEDLPEAVVDSAADRVMDILGICVAGRGSDAGRAARGLAAEWGGRPEAQLAGEPDRLPAAAAAMVNGTYSHALDFDDTHLPSIVHPSAPMVPALLAQAEAAAADGRSLTTALIASYEVNTRLAMAQYDGELGNSVFFERGFHATSIIGAVAASAGCARLRGLGAEGVMHAIAIACSMGAGLIEANRGGGSVKKFHGGWAAHSAVTAAAMAAHGLTGPPSVLEGRFGFFQAFCGDRWDPAEVTAGLGTRWDTPGIFFKPYPCNHFTHTVADCAFELRAQGLRAEDLSHVEIGTAAAPWRTIGDPIAEKRRPRSAYHGAFSAPWVFATALLRDGEPRLTRGDFAPETVGDPERLRVAGLCDVVVDGACSAVFPHQFPAVVHAVTVDGRRWDARVMANLGGPERPLSREQLLVKLRENSGGRAEAIAQAAAGLPSLASASDLLAATCGVQI